MRLRPTNGCSKGESTYAGWIEPGRDTRVGRDPPERGVARGLPRGSRRRSPAVPRAPGVRELVDEPQQALGEDEVHGAVTGLHCRAWTRDAIVDMGGDGACRGCGGPGRAAPGPAADRSP